VLAYARCPRLCSLVLKGLLDSLREVSLDAGKDFEVVLVSIDPEETPETAARVKEACVEEYGRPGAAAGWHALTGDEAQVRRLAAAVGFRYFYDPTKGEYMHASGVMVLTPEGKVSRYLLGIDYPPDTMRLALVEASGGRVGSLSDRLALLCLDYDAEAGGYRLTAMNALRAGAALTVLVMAAGLVVAWRRERRRRRAVAAGG
jgi:protein SCO1/2